MVFPFDPLSMSIGLGMEFLRSRGQKKQLQSQASTLAKSAEVSKAEAKQSVLSAIFDIGRIRQKGVRDASEIEASFAEAGVPLDQSSIAALLDLQTETELSAQMRKLGGQVEESGLLARADTETSQSQDLAKASRRTFLGLDIGSFA